jgi:hypothetical protein
MALLRVAGLPLRLAVPLSDPAVPLSESHVYVGCLRFAHLATHAERKKLRRPMAAGALLLSQAGDVGLLTLRKT